MTRATPLVLALISMVCSEGRGKGEEGSVDSASAQTTRESRSAPIKLGVEEVARGLDAPVYLTAPPGDLRRFIVEQPGRIRIVENGKLLDRPFLDITRKVGYGGERG
ncbi:MAG TPA: hypothetical protein VK481_06650, partial [Gemmatimonadaceae bacterium]|nr:hypothetical protein [Gemmatimonadaceae bacterium]